MLRFLLLILLMICSQIVRVILSLLCHSRFLMVKGRAHHRCWVIMRKLPDVVTGGPPIARQLLLRILLLRFDMEIVLLRYDVFKQLNGPNWLLFLRLLTDLNRLLFLRLLSMVVDIQKLRLVVSWKDFLNLFHIRRGFRDF